MSNLVIDIGNTALKAAWCDGVTLGKTYRYQGERVSDFILGLTEKEKPEVMVISTVRDIPPKYEARFKDRCSRLVIMDRNHPEEALSRGIVPYLSPDRTAIIVAAGYLFKGKGCTLFDMGTFMTVDFIGQDGKYAGGNISLGCRTRFKAAARYSRYLPLLDSPEEIPETGTSLKSSVESGVICGMLYEIQGYIDRFRENIVVFTGGDAIYFAKRMKNSIFVICNLVLMGLALIADEYVKNTR